MWQDISRLCNQPDTDAPCDASVGLMASLCAVSTSMAPRSGKRRWRCRRAAARWAVAATSHLRCLYAFLQGASELPVEGQILPQQTTQLLQEITSGIRLQR